jgi:hypothetical protein
MIIMMMKNVKKKFKLKEADIPPPTPPPVPNAIKFDPPYINFFSIICL